uniref:Uncharacterized protein n=1 Tax=Chromera velia CCMP2878 TaxID=1169474 RepID=A0A0G4HPE2_9ALVE|eukprot:Cvel_7733.t1-p1 / transcript=Cvel_7733.t1 / gene=Cvel_7733 / organism=Chromera_velia_CCMP2878 / gene_product=hypothetical protein / transcript_product=hypothetical protein / location=Cvel_scaffold411:34523-34729(-) / protein_length=69 / sequence_SO=supercontig / SO=protein_coding / is_pseudo=false
MSGSLFLAGVEGALLGENRKEEEAWVEEAVGETKRKEDTPAERKGGKRKRFPSAGSEKNDERITPEMLQ